MAAAAVHCVYTVQPPAARTAGSDSQVTDPRTLGGRDVARQVTVSVVVAALKLRWLLLLLLLLLHSPRGTTSCDGAGLRVSEGEQQRLLACAARDSTTRHRSRLLVHRERRG